MAQPTALTRDIQLPNQSGVIDPRLQTRKAQLARQLAQSAREPAAPPAPAKSPISTMRDNFRAFTGGRR